MMTLAKNHVTTGNLFIKLLKPINGFRIMSGFKFLLFSNLILSRKGIFYTPSFRADILCTAYVSKNDESAPAQLLYQLHHGLHYSQNFK